MLLASAVVVLVAATAVVVRVASAAVVRIATAVVVCVASAVVMIVFILVVISIKADGDDGKRREGLCYLAAAECGKQRRPGTK